jgi:hypothetical protein
MTIIVLPTYNTLYPVGHKLGNGRLFIHNGCLAEQSV